jgi:hypothetical protein
VKVRTRRLDTLFDEGIVERIDFLKIDTEGHDHAVLTGLGEHLSPARVPRVYVETGPALEPIAALMRARGYEGFSALRHPLNQLWARRRAEADGALPRHFELLGERAKNVICGGSQRAVSDERAPFTAEKPRAFAVSVRARFSHGLERNRAARSSRVGAGANRGGVRHAGSGRDQHGRVLCGRDRGVLARRGAHLARLERRDSALR